MLPVLQARETLTQANATALGSGSLKRADAQRLRGRLERQAEPGTRSLTDAPAAMKQAVLQGLGIKFRAVKREEAAKP
ncbi:MAG: hypothetical protein GEU75_10415 [Dehalococcoidia bacterium]|nr:hypothetical protein [Dehalococcoidia bacterium]